MKSKGVAIYARVSTPDRQETRNQLAQLRDFCQRQGWLVITEYIDHETGSISTRAEFQKMLLHASQRKLCAAVLGPDRLTREGTLATLQYLERLTSCQVGYKSFTGPYLDSCGTFKDVVISLLATMARQERIRMGEKSPCRAATRPQARQKTWSPAPFGVLTSWGSRGSCEGNESARTKAPFRELATKVWGQCFHSPQTLFTKRKARCIKSYGPLPQTRK